MSVEMLVATARGFDEHGEGIEPRWDRVTVCGVATEDIALDTAASMYYGVDRVVTCIDVVRVTVEVPA